MLPIDTSETVGPVGLTMRTDTVSSGSLQMLIQILRDVSGASLSRSVSGAGTGGTSL
jgi:LysR family pca operon transcriptional activator